MTQTTALRRSLVALWLAVAVTVLATVAVSRLAPVLGLRVVIVGGGSMSPSIPIGSLLAERAVGRESVSAGDVVTLELPGGVAVTHRVTRIVEVDGTTMLETRGDANTEPDAALVPASTVSGVAVLHVPVAGFVLAVLGLPTGVVFVLTALVALLFGIWLLEDRAAATGPRPATEAVYDVAA